MTRYMTMPTFTVIHSHLTNAIPHQLDQRIFVMLISLPYVRLHFAPAFLISTYNCILLDMVGF